ncbi:MAG TPA: hypothetical protein VG711_06080 [Phycisphaerales bacterium]|nr:hypothetical protein [Phycisphaerales bacterium]
MTSNQIRDALRAQPFLPFVLKTTGGRQYRVDHPELAILAPSGRTMSVVSSADTFAILDVLMIESINIIKGGKSGRWKRAG